MLFTTSRLRHHICVLTSFGLLPSTRSLVFRSEEASPSDDELSDIDMDFSFSLSGDRSLALLLWLQYTVITHNKQHTSTLVGYITGSYLHLHVLVYFLQHENSKKFCTQKELITADWNYFALKTICENATKP